MTLRCGFNFAILRNLPPLTASLRDADTQQSIATAKNAVESRLNQSAQVSIISDVIVGCLFRPSTFGSRQEIGAGAIHRWSFTNHNWGEQPPKPTRVCSQTQSALTRTGPGPELRGEQQSIDAMTATVIQGVLWNNGLTTLTMWR